MNGFGCDKIETRIYAKRCYMFTIFIFDDQHKIISNVPCPVSCVGRALWLRMRGGGGHSRRRREVVPERSVCYTSYPKILLIQHSKTSQEHNIQRNVQMVNSDQFALSEFAVSDSFGCFDRVQCDKQRQYCLYGNIQTENLRYQMTFLKTQFFK